jgi:hypothetical protein
MRNENKEVVVLGIMPQDGCSPAVWGLARLPAFSFFKNTHLMHYAFGSRNYVPMRVNAAQPAKRVSAS